ncbi:MAG: hypothetical protein HKN90_10360, partial [Flavobacteriaceae bacterium]|nr:hypothetical protein [Flavobacteriaceae bacterium]
MLDYLVKVLLFQTLFLVIYDLVLKKETFFQWNRGYLLITSLMAYVIPLIKIRKVEEVLPQDYVILLPEIVLSPQTVIKEQFDWSSFLFTALTWIVVIGIIVACALFLVKLLKVLELIQTSEIKKENGYHLVYIDSNSPFSFFSYIFLDKNLSEESKQRIIAHELVHVEQRHSLDLLFFELQRMVIWFNPFSYIYQKRIAELHEYIADSKSIKIMDKADYFQNMLGVAFGTQKISFINPFFRKSLIKKRLAMLNRQRSKQLFKFKYLLLLPLLAGMLIYTSCEKGDEAIVNKNSKRLITLHMGGDGILDKKEIQSKKEGYFDMYLFGAKPSGKEITYTDLSENEKEDFDKYMLKIKNSDHVNYFSHKLYLMNDGTKSIMQHIDWKEMKADRNSKDYSNVNVV